MKTTYKTGDYITNLNNSWNVRKILKCKVRGKGLKWAETEAEGMVHLYPLGNIRLATYKEIIKKFPNYKKSDILTTLKIW